MDGQDPGRQTAIFLVWFLCGISLLIVLLRLGSRIFIVRILALDDLLIIPAMAFGIAMAVMAYVAYRDGTDQVLRTALSYIQVVPFYLSQMFGRISFAVTLLDIMGTDRFRRRLIYALIALQFVVCLIGLATALGPCQHVSDQWTSWDMGPDSCFAKQMRVSMNGSQWFISIADALFDIVLACMPALVLGGLRLKLSVKLGLIFLMSLGVVAGVASLIRLYYLTHGINDPTAPMDPWSAANWTTAQEFILLIAVSVPGTWPLVRRLFNLRHPRLTSARSGRRSGAYGHSQPSAGPDGAAAAAAPKPPPLVVRWWPRQQPGVGVAGHAGGSVAQASRSRSFSQAPPSGMGRAHGRWTISRPVGAVDASAPPTPSSGGRGFAEPKPLGSSPTSPSEEYILQPRHAIAKQTCIEVTEEERQGSSSEQGRPVGGRHHSDNEQPWMV